MTSKNDSLEELLFATGEARSVILESGTCVLEKSLYVNLLSSILKRDSIVSWECFGGAVVAAPPASGLPTSEDIPWIWLRLGSTSRLNFVRHGSTSDRSQCVQERIWSTLFLSQDLSEIEHAISCCFHEYRKNFELHLSRLNQLDGCRCWITVGWQNDGSISQPSTAQKIATRVEYSVWIGSILVCTLQRRCCCTNQ